MVATRADLLGTNLIFAWRLAGFIIVLAGVGMQSLNQLELGQVWQHVYCMVRCMYGLHVSRAGLEIGTPKIRSIFELGPKVRIHFFGLFWIGFNNSFVDLVDF